MYELVVFIHILAAMVWVGGGLFAQFNVMRLGSQEGAIAVGRYFADIEWTGPRIFGPASGLALLTGITMVVLSDAWAFSQLWVVSALTLFVISSILQGAIGGKALKGMSEMVDGGDTDSAEFASLQNRVQLINNADTLIILSIVALMVFKPGV